MPTDRPAVGHHHACQLGNCPSSPFSLGPDLGGGQHAVSSHSFSLPLSTPCVSYLSFAEKKRCGRMTYSSLPVAGAPMQGSEQRKTRRTRVRAESPTVVSMLGTCSKHQAPGEDGGREFLSCYFSVSHLHNSLPPLPSTPTSPSQDNSLDIFSPNCF